MRPYHRERVAGTWFVSSRSWRWSPSGWRPARRRRARPQAREPADGGADSPTRGAGRRDHGRARRDAPPSHPAVPAQPSRPGSTRQLIAAAWDDDVVRARRLIARGADVNAQDATQQSAFLIAASEGYVDLLDLTMQHGADLDSKDSFNGTALIRATERGHAAIAASAGARRHRRRPRQRPRVDGLARVGDPRRRQRALRRHRAGPRRRRRRCRDPGGPRRSDRRAARPADGPDGGRGPARRDRGC